MEKGLLFIIIATASCFWVDNVVSQNPETLYDLRSYPAYSLVLPLDLEGDKNETFLVQSPRFHRIMSVIQFLSLSPKHDFTCGSYLEFQDGLDTHSPKICGNFDPDEKSYAPSSLIGPRTYISSRDTLRVSLIHLTKGKLTKVYARISFTAFRDDCYFLQKTPNNSTTGGLPRYRPCEYSTTSDGIGRHCIVSSLFCDQVMNCAPTDLRTGTDFAQDESELNCPHLYYVPPDKGPLGGLNNQSAEGLQVEDQEENDLNTRSEDSSSSSNNNDRRFRHFFDEREEHLANLFKSAIIGFVGICTVCILIAFIISIFCVRQQRKGDE